MHVSKTAADRTAAVDTPQGQQSLARADERTGKHASVNRMWNAHMVFPSGEMQSPGFSGISPCNPGRLPRFREFDGEPRNALRAEYFLPTGQVARARQIVPRGKFESVFY